MTRAGENREIGRVLARMTQPGSVLLPDRNGRGYAVFPGGDRRRRPSARLSAGDARRLASDGALEAVPAREGYCLTPAGQALALRLSAAPGEAFSAQHRPVHERAVADGDGGVRRVRGHAADGALRRLLGLRGASGEPWLSADEFRAAQRLRADWDLGQVGLVRGSDWSAAPRSGAARSGGAAQEALLAAGCDARARVADALGALAAPLRRVVEGVCLYETGLEALERAENWPARSGKIALKLGLAQLAAMARG